MSLLVSELTHDERPRERFLSAGKAALSDAELLAIILRTGTRQENVLHFAQRLLNHFGSLQHLKKATLEELQKVHGVGLVKAIEIQAVIELGYRTMRVAKIRRGQVTSSFALGQDLIEQMRDLEQEHLVAIYLTTKNEIIKELTIFVGSLNQSIAHPREIFKGAVRASAAGIVLAHNHPSNNLDPSQNDLNFTKRIVDAGNLMGIRILDHLIIGHNDYRSLKEEGYI